mmetsp:Transcript_40737/g.73183  ORF Transcript_40737/g.73183 Transcript_40737/m.73183 type:complete len:217 (-) Transcript_40737:551-1201(-)
MARGISPPHSRRSQRLSAALAEFGRTEQELGRLAPMSPNTNLYLSAHNPPQRPFVTDLRLSPAQRARTAYSPHWLERVESPGCGLVPESFFHVRSYGPALPSTAPAGLSLGTWPFAKGDDNSLPHVSSSRAMEVDGLRVARTASKVVDSAQFRSRLFYERKPITMRSTHNYNEFKTEFDRGRGDAPRLRYKERLKLFHTFDGRVIHSKLMRPESVG